MFIKLNEELEKYVQRFTDKTGIPYYDDMLKHREYYEEEKNIVFDIVNMTPEEYIERCIELFKDRGMESTIKDVIQERQDKSLERLKDRLQKNELINIPYIDYKSETQEGLHRAIACYELGIQNIPVMIIK